jgi:hypothetical protein
MTNGIPFILSLICIVPALGLAQSNDDRKLEVGGQLAVTDLDELETTDFGFGGRFGFRATELLTFEGELNFFASDIPEEVPVTSSRFEGLFGVKIGPRFDRFSVFGKVRPGFLRFGEAPAPFPCIAIYPPPLSCIVGGKTAFALDLGGGVELYPTERSFVRFDVSDLMLDYPGPALRRNRGEFAGDGGFWGHNLRFAAGAGFRF